ncbi:DUF397 domain-containing protein [Kitasatospora sp. NPDC058162]|uniref:DUF397 domain-containing protein n=1 Tax=Kitasatospora sp. NPDC058162 TaxID=3346362 RepID=UPI0036DD291D
MTHPTFKKSTYSAGDVNCVEVAIPGGPNSYIRDSKDLFGPILVFDRAAHEAFMEAISAGEFDFGLL